MFGAAGFSSGPKDGCHRTTAQGGGSEARHRSASSLPVQVAELHVLLAALLLVEERAEGVEFGFGRVALAGDVHLIVPAVDEVRGDGRGQPLGARRRRHEAEADVALQGVAVGAAGGGPGQQAVAVDGLAPPRPQVQLRVVVLQDQHDEPPGHAVLALLQQGLAAEEICVLEEAQRGGGGGDESVAGDGRQTICKRRTIPLGEPLNQLPLW